MRWSESPDWLPPNEVPADLLTDLKTTDNALSLWVVDDEKENLATVTTALAAGKQHVENFDYVLVDLQRLEDLATSLGFVMERTHGNTRYEAANQYHLDLSQITGSRLVEIARVLLEHGKPDRKDEWEVRPMLEQALRDGAISKVNRSLRKELAEISPE